MGSRDSSAQPPHIHHHPYLQHHHHPAQQQPAHHGVVMIPHSQTQHFSLNNPYTLLGSDNAVETTVTNTTMIHQENAKFPFNSISAATLEPKPQDHQYSDGPSSGSGAAWLGIEPAKKKRGRPRKYSPDDSIGLGLSPAPGAQVQSAMDHVDSSGAGGTFSSDTPGKRNRGRPPGSGKKQMNALGISGVGFTPHVIIVNPGEDIVSKIMDFSQQGPRTVCILSATGAVCNVNLRQTTVSATVAYEGRFDIISLSGSLPSSEVNGTNSESGNLSVSFSGSDGRVVGGGVAGVLKAASSVQIIVGSFVAEGKKPKTTISSTPPSHLLKFSGPLTGASPSSGGSSDSGEENGDTNLINRTHGSSYPNTGQPNHGIPMYPMGYSMKMHPTN